MKLFNNDSGASAIVIAISMLVLMGFAALVVDVGAGFNERAQDQSAADAGALAGGVSLMADSGGVLDTVVPSIRTYVSQTVGRAITDEQWKLCVDPNQLAITEGGLRGSALEYQCISFGPNDQAQAYGKIRVRVPDQDIATTFGAVLGAATLRTSATAEVQLKGTLGAGTFPSGVGIDANPGELHCFSTGEGSSSKPKPSPDLASKCGNSASGNFGTFLPYFYTDVPGSTDSRCESGQGTTEMGYFLGAGMDHFLYPSPQDYAFGDSDQIVSGDDCTGFPGNGFEGPINPNTVKKSGGNQPSDLLYGLITGQSGGYIHDGRLAVSSSSANIHGQQIDNNPLWKFIDTDQVDKLEAGQAKTACTEAANAPDFSTTATEIIDAEGLMADCLSKWNTAVGESTWLFTQHIMSSPRLVNAPVFWETKNEIENSPNSAPLNIHHFTPLFIEGLWFKNSGSVTCSGVYTDDDACVHLPGMEGSVSQNGNPAVNSSSAFVLTCGMLPPDYDQEPAEERCKRIDPTPASGGEATVFLDLELTR